MSLKGGRSTVAGVCTILSAVAGLVVAYLHGGMAELQAGLTPALAAIASGWGLIVAADAKQ